MANGISSWNPVKRLWRRYRDRQAEYGAWELAEALRASIGELEAQLNACTGEGVDEALLQQAHKELATARRLLGHRNRHRRLASSHLTTALIHVNSARALRLRLIAPGEVKALLPELVALVKEHLDERDPRYTAAEKIWTEQKKVGPQDVQRLSDAVGAAQMQALREQFRVGSFVRIVKYVTCGLTLTAIGVAILGFLWPEKVPLCFAPQAPLGSIGGGFSAVCPVGSRRYPADEDTDQAMSATASPGDYVVLEIIGLIAAGISAASALRKINGTATPYPVPVSLAVLKLPTGALTAVLGIILMRGGFVPGLSALDSSAQIIAWSVIFGYAQQLFTKFVDKQGQAVLDAVRGPSALATSTPADINVD